MAAQDDLNRQIESLREIRDLNQENVDIFEAYESAIESLLTTDIRRLKVRQQVRKIDIEGKNIGKALLDTGKNILKASKDTLELRKQIGISEKEIKKISELVAAQRAKGNIAEAEAMNKKLNLLRLQNIEANAQADALKSAIPGGEAMVQITKWGGAIGKALGSAFDIFKIGFNIAKKILGVIKDLWGDYDKIDKKIREITSNLGLAGGQANAFRSSVMKSVVAIQTMGADIGEVLSIQETLNDAIGRQVILSSENLINITKIVQGTSLGVAGTAQMLENLEVFGFNADDTFKVIEKTVQSNQKLGLASSKVLKTINDNLKRAQGFAFKGGIEGLTRMAQQASKVKLDLGDIFSLAEKLFEPEGAIEMSAQLQVLGGSFSQLADPFQLMFQARNDVEGLANSIVEATKGIAKFNKQTGEFDIAAVELHRLRKVAEATNIPFEKLNEMVLQTAKRSQILGRTSFKFDKEQMDTIASIAKIGKGGDITITMPDGTVRAIESFSEGDFETLMRDNTTLEQFAKNRMTLMERFENFFKTLRITLAPVFDTISNKIFNSGIFERLDGFSKTIFEIVSNKVVPMVDKMIEGFPEFLGKVADKIEKIIKTIDDIFSGQGSGLNKITKTLGVLLGDVLWEGFKQAVKLAQSVMGCAASDVAATQLKKFTIRRGD